MFNSNCLYNDLLQFGSTGGSDFGLQVSIDEYSGDIFLVGHSNGPWSGFTPQGNVVVVEKTTATLGGASSLMGSPFSITASGDDTVSSSAIDFSTATDDAMLYITGLTYSNMFATHLGKYEVNPLSLKSCVS